MCSTAGPDDRRGLISLNCTDRCTIIAARRDLLRPVGPDQARDPSAPGRRPGHDRRARGAVRADAQRGPEARRRPRARRPRRDREGRAGAPVPARTGRPRRGDRVDRRLSPRVGRASRSLRAVRRTHGGRRRVSLDLRGRAADRRPSRAGLRRVHRPGGPARVLRPGRSRMDRRIALRPARRRGLVDPVRPGAGPALPPPPRVRGDRTPAPDPDRLDRDPARRLEL